MSSEFLRALIDPTAPLPANWPGGVPGIFLLFCLPVGGGIPLGVILARNAGLSPVMTAGLYLGSDIVLATLNEPLLALARWLSRRSNWLARLGQTFERLSSRVGLREDGVRGPLGLILVAFSISPTTGRAAAAAAGHGCLSGWSLAIVGDMLYFGVLMATTLWVTSIFGEDRTTIGAILMATWLLPVALRYLRRRHRAPRAVGESLAPAAALATVTGSSASPESPARAHQPPPARRRRRRAQR